MERQGAKAHHVPNDWQVVRLGDIAEVVRGVSWSREQESTVSLDDAIPVIRISNVQRDGFHMEDMLYIRGVPQTDRIRGSITPRTLVMVGSNGNRDRVGNIFLANRHVTGHLLASFLIGIEPDEGTSERFLSASLRSSRNQALITESTAGSTGLKNLSLKWLRNLRVDLPPLPEQRAIADVLDAIDEAIERAEAFIDATERLRNALLHDLLTRGVPGWHSEWREVPGLGTVPTAWDVVRLGERAKILSGAAFSSAYFSSNEGLPLIRNRDINSSDTELRYFGPYDDKYLVHPGDLLVRMDGDFQAAKWKGRLALLNQRVARVSVSRVRAGRQHLVLRHPQALGPDPAPNDRDDGQASVGGADRCHPDPRRVRARAASHRRHARQRRRHYRASGRGAACITIIEGVGVGRAAHGARTSGSRSRNCVMKFCYADESGHGSEITVIGWHRG